MAIVFVCLRASVCMCLWPWLAFTRAVIFGPFILCSMGLTTACKIQVVKDDRGILHPSGNSSPFPFPY